MSRRKHPIVAILSFAYRKSMKPFLPREISVQIARAFEQMDKKMFSVAVERKFFRKAVFHVHRIQFFFPCLSHPFRNAFGVFLFSGSFSSNITRL